MQNHLVKTNLLCMPIPSPSTAQLNAPSVISQLTQCHLLNIYSFLTFYFTEVSYSAFIECELYSWLQAGYWKEYMYDIAIGVIRASMRDTLVSTKVYRRRSYMGFA